MDAGGLPHQDLLGKTMVVVRHDGTTVIDIAPDEWVLLRDEFGGRVLR